LILISADPYSNTSLATNDLTKTILTELEFLGHANVPSPSMGQQKVINPGLERVEATQIQFAKRVSTMYEDWMLNKIASVLYEAQVSSIHVIPDPAIGGCGVPTFREEDLNEVDYASSLFPRKSELVEAFFNVTLFEYGLRVIYVRADTGANKHIRVLYELVPTA
jgi:hypothetical protein